MSWLSYGLVYSGMASLSSFGSSAILSGSIASGYISGYISVISSSASSLNLSCKRCRQPVSIYSGNTVTATWGDYYCYACAGYSIESGFQQKEDWIRDSVPGDYAKLPAPILADYLEENGRRKDADYLRSLDSSR